MRNKTKIKEFRNIYKDKKIVLACGCFDLFHIGHLEYLKGAKEIGDILIVLVNSDTSYKQLKSKYPIFSENSRMEIISSIKYVDHVLLFNELDACEPMKIIKPDFFVKGPEYKTKNIKEFSCAKEIECKIAFIGDTKLASSSDLKKLLGRC